MKIKDIALSAAYVGQRVVKAIAVGAQEVWSAVKYIVFADPVVEQICATNFGNGKGLTEEQAAKVTSIGTVFKGNTEITSFDEFELFTGLTSTGDRAFESCANLNRIVLPSSLTELSCYAFYGCSSLKNIVIPEGVHTIGERVFVGCAQIGNIYIPRTITNIGDMAFANTGSPIMHVADADSWVRVEVFPTNVDRQPNNQASKVIVGDDTLKDIVIPSDVETIPLGRFIKFSNIKSVNLNQAHTIENNGFSGMSALETVDLGSVTTIGSSAFAQCSMLKSIYIDNVVSLADRVFNGCSNLSTPMRFSSQLLVVNEHTFRSCAKIPYFDFRRHTQVPTLSSTNAFDAPKKIVVPDALYDEWIAATNWVSFASKIVKASEFVEP